MRDRLASLGLTAPLVAGRPLPGVDVLEPPTRLTAKDRLPLDGTVPVSRVSKLFTDEEAKVQKLMHLTPALRAEAVSSVLPGLAVQGPLTPQPFKLTPRKSWVPGSGALTFRNASVVAVHSDTASFGWMVSTSGGIAVGGWPNENSIVDIWVAPDVAGLVLVLLRVNDSPAYMNNRATGVEPGATYTVTNFDGVTQTFPMTGNHKSFPLIFTAGDTGWRRCRVSGEGWPWRFWSAEVMYPR
jgi:hypothetical protein